jgi:DNA polymerase III subunit alpha
MRQYYHLVLLARDSEGYRNLVRLTSIGYLEGFYHRPRIDREVLERHSKGLIVTSACMAGEVARTSRPTAGTRRRRQPSWYANVFDGRYYLEVQAHDTPGQRALNAKVFRSPMSWACPSSRPTTRTSCVPRTTTRTTSCSASDSARTARTRTG